MIQVEGIFAGGSDSTKSYTLEIKTENPKSNANSVIYYSNESGTHEKISIYLTTSYKTITFCDGFLAVSRDNSNTTSTIRCLDSYDHEVISLSTFDNNKYGVWIAPSGNMVLNITCLLEEYPNVEKIVLSYMD